MPIDNNNYSSMHKKPVLHLLALLVLLTAPAIANASGEGIVSEGTDLPFSIGNTRIMTLTKDGLGISTQTPTAPLDTGAGKIKAGSLEVTATATAGSLEVTKSIKVGMDNSACTSALAGTIRFNPGTSVFEGCNGTDWVSFAPKAAHEIITVDGECESVGCFVDCPAGYIATGGGYNTWWGEHMDANRPRTNGRNGWFAYDNSWKSGNGPLAVSVRCLKIN